MKGCLVENVEGENPNNEIQSGRASQVEVQYPAWLRLMKKIGNVSFELFYLIADFVWSAKFEFLIISAILITIIIVHLLARQRDKKDKKAKRQKDKKTKRQRLKD